jgi:hypothetical protein
MTTSSTEKVIIRVDPEPWKKAKRHAIDREITLSNLIEKFLRKNSASGEINISNSSLDHKYELWLYGVRNAGSAKGS